MKPNVRLTRSLLLLLLLTCLFLLGCNLLSSIVKPGAKENTPEDIQTSVAPKVPAVTSTRNVPLEPTATEIPPTETPYDLSQAGLPEGIPIYPDAYGFSGIPGLMLDFKVDVDVRTASAYYDEKMKALGWSGFSTGGSVDASCGGDCGPVPTKTPGPGPTATPDGWMRTNNQIWSMGSKQILIGYLVNAEGTTEVTISFFSQ